MPYSLPTPLLRTGPRGMQSTPAVLRISSNRMRLYGHSPSTFTTISVSTVINHDAQYTLVTSLSELSVRSFMRDAWRIRCTSCGWRTPAHDDYCASPKCPPGRVLMRRVNHARIRKYQSIYGREFKKIVRRETLPFFCVRPCRAKARPS